MGGGYFSNEDPSTQVCVSLSFWIDQTPVSEAQFKQFNGQAAQKPNFNGNNFPVDTISWVEAKNFCELNRGGRLPTEIEWEYAARGPSNLIYSWGNRFDSSKLIYLYNANGRIGEVNRDMTNLAASSWVGAIDMTGNIWQWVSSIYGSYPYNPSLAENNNDIKSNRVVRGGAWNSSQLYVGTTVRFNYPPKFSGDNVGFRCAHSV